MSRLSEKEQWAILHEADQGKSLPDDARDLGHALWIVKRWFKAEKATSHVMDKHRSGCKPKLTAGAKAKAVELLLSNQHGGSKHVAK